MKSINHFKPAFALTVHKSHGIAINKPYGIYECDKMKHDMLYVCLTRTKEKQYVNFCEMSIYKPFKAYIYRYSHNNKSYIGSTKNTKKRHEKHEFNDTFKFGSAIKRIGFDNFKYEILEEVDYYDMSEVYEIENNYIMKYDAVNNGFNTRHNRSMALTEI